MTIDINFTVNNLVDNIIKEAIARGLDKASVILRNEAVAGAPVDTGTLKNSIDRDSDDTRAVVFTNVEYGIYQEYGTGRMTAHPFMRPALFNNRADLTDIVNDEVSRALR